MRFALRPRSLRILVGAICCLSLLSCKSSTDAESGSREQTVYFDKEQKNVSVPGTYGRSAVSNWQVIDDRTMLIETYTRDKYVATFATRCPWLRSAFRIGFVTRGPFALDRSTKVVFPEGHSCRFISLQPFVPLESTTTPESLEVTEDPQ